MRRTRARFECFGKEGLLDGRRGLSRRRRISAETTEEICRLKRERYADFSIRHFHEFLTERHGIAASYAFVRDLLQLQLRGLADKVRGRGRYLRKRERRPMPGMLLHLDASTHTWIEGLPQQDLVVMLDDADFCRTDQAGAAPADEQNGQLTRVLRTLGIEHILARTPEAPGRSPPQVDSAPYRGASQELRLHGVRSYQAANDFLDSTFDADFDRRFRAAPRERGNAFTSLGRLDLRLLVSARHERIVQKDNTVVFERLFLQSCPPPPTAPTTLAARSSSTSWSTAPSQSASRAPQSLASRAKALLFPCTRAGEYTDGGSHFCRTER